MPGYYVHLAACKPEARKSISFVHGVEAPDILKKYFKLYGISGAKSKYNNLLKTTNMPDFQKFEKRIQQKEVMGAGTGLHYGLSSKPDTKLCWDSLSEEEKNQPFTLINVCDRHFVLPDNIYSLILPDDLPDLIIVVCIRAKSCCISLPELQEPYPSPDS